MMMTTPWLPAWLLTCWARSLVRLATGCAANNLGADARTFSKRARQNRDRNLGAGQIDAAARSRSPTC